MDLKKVHDAPPKFSSLPLKSYLPNAKVVFRPPIFQALRRYVKLRGSIETHHPLPWRPQPDRMVGSELTRKLSVHAIVAKQFQ